MSRQFQGPGEQNLADHDWFHTNNGDERNGYDFLTAPPVLSDSDIEVLRNGGPASIERQQSEGATTSDCWTVLLPVNTNEPYQLLGQDLTRRKARIRYSFSTVNSVGVVMGSRNVLSRPLTTTLRDGYVLLMGDTVEVEHCNELYVNTWQIVAPDATAQVYVSVIVQRNHV